MNRLDILASHISQSTLDFSSLQTLQVEKKDKVATIWINSLHNYNAISFLMIDQINFVFPTLDRDPDVKIIEIRSKHPKFFCSGGDMKDVILNFPNDRNNSSKLFSISRTIRSVKKPIIAVVDGEAIGGGFQLCLFCDIILCSERASFSLPELKHGLVPGLGGCQNLARIIGTKLATKIILSGETLKAREAERLNIAHCYPQNSFEEEVSKFIDKLVNKALDSLEFAKKAVNISMETTLDQGLEYEATLFQTLFSRDSAKEGLSAFVEKRKPNFKNI